MRITGLVVEQKVRSTESGDMRLLTLHDQETGHRYQVQLRGLPVETGVVYEFCGYVQLSKSDSGDKWFTNFVVWRVSYGEQLNAR